MDPDVTNRRFIRKIFTFLWLKHGLIATFPAPGPTSPPRINDISEKVAKSAVVYSYANRHIVQYYMEKHIRRIAQSKISFWTHLSFLCLRIRLHDDHLFDYFLNICSITTEAALFCNWQRLDDVHAYASTFFEAFFEKELSYYFHNAGGWPGLLNYINDNNLLLAHDMVEPYISIMACPSHHVPVLVRVVAEKLSAGRRERIASARELKSEEIERMGTVRLLAAKIFDWEFVEQQHIPSLKPGVFKRVANIRRKSRSKTISTDLPKPQNPLCSFKGDEQKEHKAVNAVSQMKRLPDLVSPGIRATLHDESVFHGSVSVRDTPSPESSNSVLEDEVFYPADSVENDSFLVTSSWLKYQETKYERQRNTSSRSSQSRDANLNQINRKDFSHIRESECNETSFEYDNGEVPSSSAQNKNNENKVAGLDVIQRMTSTYLSSVCDSCIEEHSPKTLNANGKSKVIDFNSAQTKTSTSSLERDDKRNLNAQNVFHESKAIDLDSAQIATNTHSSNYISTNDVSCHSNTVHFLKEVMKQKPKISSDIKTIKEMPANLNKPTKQIYFNCRNFEFHEGWASKRNITTRIGGNDTTPRNRTEFLSNSPTYSKRTSSNGSITVCSKTEHSIYKSPEGMSCPNALFTKQSKIKHLCNKALQVQIDPNASFTKQSKNDHAANKPFKMHTNANIWSVKQSKTEDSRNGSSDELKNDDVKVLNDASFRADGSNTYSLITNNLDSHNEAIDLHQSSNHPFDFAGVESIAIGPNQTVHYRKHHTGSVPIMTHGLETETHVGCSESSNGNKQSRVGISEELNILPNSDSIEFKSDSESAKRLYRDCKNIEQLVDRLKKSGVSDPVVFKI